MVLAAGAGERLRPLTEQLPKPLLPVANRPVMAYGLEHLAAHGFRDVIANVCHHAQAIETAFADGSGCGVRLRYAREDRLWGSAGSVKRAAAVFGDETFLVVCADNLNDLDVGDLVARHRRARALASIGLVQVSDTSQYGIVVTDDRGRIERFVEKPRGPAPSRLANAGIYVFEPEICERIPADVPYDFGLDVFPQLVRSGAAFHGFELPGQWRDIGRLRDYLAAQRDVMEGSFAARVPGRSVQPRVWVGEGCEIHPQARLEAPVVIGERCRIGAGAVLGGGTSVASDVVVPEGTRLWSCVLWQGARVPPGADLSRAVVGREGVLATCPE